MVLGALNVSWQTFKIELFKRLSELSDWFNLVVMLLAVLKSVVSFGLLEEGDNTVNLRKPLVLIGFVDDFFSGFLKLKSFP